MPVDLSKVERVLIVKLSAIGDVVHALPVSAALKKSFPHLKLSWAVETKCAEMVRGNPYLDEIIEIPRHAWKGKRRSPVTWMEGIRFFRGVRQKNFDLAVDLQGLLKSAMVAYFSGAKKRVGYHWQREGAKLLVKAIPQRPQSIHIVDQYLDVAYALGAKVEPVEFPLWIPDEAFEISRSILRETGVSASEPYVLINPSAGHPKKRWEPKRFAELSDRLQQKGMVKPIFVGGPADKELGDEIASLKVEPMVSVIGQTSLKQLAAMLKESAAHVCGDTGSGHIASAVGTKCVAIFGPTAAERSCPYGQLETTLHKDQLCKECPAGKCVRFECINWITVDEVYDMLCGVLEAAHARA